MIVSRIGSGELVNTEAVTFIRKTADKQKVAG